MISPKPLNPSLKLLVKKYTWEYWLLILLIGFSAAIYSFVSIYKHLHFQTFAWDTSVFIQQLYYLAQFKYPISTLLSFNVLGDHFQILFLALGGTGYLLWRDPKVLFILQAVVFCISGFPLYFISKHFLTRTKLPVCYQISLSLLIVTAYLFNVTSQSMLTDEFHNEPLAALPLLLMLYFLITKQHFGYWLSLIVVILSKEIFGLLGLPVGLYIFLKYRDIKKALVTVLLGVSSSYFLLFHLMPYLSSTTQYIHFGVGNTTQDLFTKIYSQPSLLVTEFFNRWQKLNTIISSLLYFSFIPLLAIPELILPLFSLAIRFFDDTTPRLYEFNNHYAVPLIPFMAFTAVVGLYNLIIWLQTREVRVSLIGKSLLILLILTIGVQDIIFHGPLNSIFKAQFYQFNSWERDDYQLINQVPPNAIIASQNSLLPHLSERKSFYLLPKIENADYIVVDLEEGPNKFSPLPDSKVMGQLIDNQIRQNKYKIIWQKHKTILLKKI